MKLNVFSKGIIAFILCLASVFGYAQKEQDPLNKRIFNISLNEIKDGQPTKKLLPDKIEFKGGKLFSDFVFDKYQFKWIKYRIEKDSIYTDSTDTEVRFFQIEATATDEGNQTIMMSFTILEWDIEGSIKITKNDKLKKHFEFVGREKGGKPKKKKKGDTSDKMRMEGEPAEQKKE